ncbi:Protein SPEAR4 [Linum grandiflorum]
MCTTSISSGTGGDGSGGTGGTGGSGDSHQSMFLSKTTKNKKQKVPKRGPGVAELEKILRQQNRQPNPTAAAVTSSFPPSLFSISSPPRSQLYSLVPHHPTSFPSENSSSTSSRSGFQFPLSNHVNGGSSFDHHQMQRFQQQPSSPTMMNLFPSSSSSEPPSNQIRQFPDQPTMTGGKRQYPFYIDNTAGETPSFRFQAPSWRTNHDTDSRGNMVLMGCPTTRERHSMFYNPSNPMQQRAYEAYDPWITNKPSPTNKPPPFYRFLEEPRIINDVESDGEEEGGGIDLRLKL